MYFINVRIYDRNRQKKAQLITKNAIVIPMKKYKQKLKERDFTVELHFFFIFLLLHALVAASSTCSEKRGSPLWIYIVPRVFKF